MFIHRLSLFWKRFAPLEEQILSAIRDVLPEGAQPTFDAQVGGITRVQRSPPKWNEILFYRMRRGKADWSGVPLFPRKDEFRLAKVSFSVDGKQFTAALGCVAGHIFDLTVIPGPKRVSFVSFDGPPSVMLQDDPLETATGKRTEVLPELWQRYLQQQATRSQQPPSGWVFYDASNAHRVALGDRELLVLAEREGDQFLLYSVEPQVDDLFTLDGHDCDEPKVFKGSLDTFFGIR